MKKRKEIADYMASIGLKALPGTATFYFFVSISPSRLTSEEFSTRLLFEHFISVVPGLGYGNSCDKFIRVSIGTASVDEIKRGLTCIKKLIEDTTSVDVPESNNVLVVAGGLWQAPLIQYLKNKGHNVFVVDPYLHSPGVQYADRHIQCDVRNFAKVQELVSQDHFAFIASDQSDISVNTVARLNSFLKLPGNSVEIVDKFVNKYHMRRHAESVGIPIPRYAKIESVNKLKGFIKESGLPIIIKPADSQSSRGVIKIDEGNLLNLDQYFVASLKFANCGYLIAEEFVEGHEITVEGYASDRRHRTLAISSKKHFRTGIASELEYPAAIPEHIYHEIERINDLFVETAELKFGITHAEYMINFKDGRIILVEIACRGGGTLISSDIVNWVSGVNVYDAYYNDLKGISTDVKRLKVLKRNAILKFFEFKPGVVKSIRGFEEMKRIKGIVSCGLSFKPGDLLQPAEDDRTRQGYFIAFAESKSDLDEITNKASETLTVSYE